VAPCRHLRDGRYSHGDARGATTACAGSKDASSRCRHDPQLHVLGSAKSIRGLASGRSSTELLDDPVSAIARRAICSDLHPAWLFAGLSVVQSRLALRAHGCQMLVGRDGDDGLHFTIQQSRGGAAGGGTRRELRERGALTMACGSGRHLFVGGIVCDEVTAVRVDEVAAHLQGNAFLADRPRVQPGARVLSDRWLRDHHCDARR
jgi:hypothetical protein